MTTTTLPYYGVYLLAIKDVDAPVAMFALLQDAEEFAKRWPKEAVEIKLTNVSAITYDTKD